MVLRAGKFFQWETFSPEWNNRQKVYISQGWVGKAFDENLKKRRGPESMKSLKAAVVVELWYEKYY